MFIVLFLVTKRSYSSTFNCVSYGACGGRTFECQNGENCYINCLDQYACQNSIVYCPSGPYDCIITSSRLCASWGSYIYGSSRGGNLIINAESGDGPHFPYVTCPSNGGHCNLTHSSGGHGWGGQSIITAQPTTGLLYIHIGGGGFNALRGGTITCPKRQTAAHQPNCIVNVYGGAWWRMNNLNVKSSGS